MDVKGRNALVIGMARSGIASAKLLCEEGASVTINDSKTAEKLSGLETLHGLNVEDALGKPAMEAIEGKDLIVLSPGVPMRSPFVQKALQNGAEVIGEIELGYRFAKAPILAITGTNGKTTTTTLAGEICKAAGKRTYVLGNIGVPIVQEARSTTPDDVIVAEIAGFQLESSRDFHAHSCAVLNVTEDHLDRFLTMENYAATKAMVLRNQTEEDFAALNADDPLVAAMADRVLGKLLWFSRLHEVEEGAFVREGWIVFRMDGREQVLCRVEELKIPGPHNLENALAAVCVTLAVGIDGAAAARALRAFEGVEHRIEFVCETDGVRYINDSKGTNPDSTVKAVEAMARPTVLLLGGSNKNSDYCPVFRAFDGRIKAVVAYGFTRDQILRDAQKTGYQDIFVCGGSFEDAVKLADSLANPGDNVLLSPACASYDMFDNFEQRGRVFKEIVRTLRR